MYPLYYELHFLALPTTLFKPYLQKFGIPENVFRHGDQTREIMLRFEDISLEQFKALYQRLENDASALNTALQLAKARLIKELVGSLNWSIQSNTVKMSAENQRLLSDGFQHDFDLLWQLSWQKQVKFPHYMFQVQHEAILKRFIYPWRLPKWELFDLGLYDTVSYDQAHFAKGFSRFGTSMIFPSTLLVEQLQGQAIPDALERFLQPNLIVDISVSGAAVFLREFEEDRAFVKLNFFADLLQTLETQNEEVQRQFSFLNLLPPEVQYPLDHFDRWWSIIREPSPTDYEVTLDMI
jgi:hypothetical protein